VIPTTGRQSLRDLLEALSESAGPLPGRALVVDDRTDRRDPLPAPGGSRLEGRIEVLAGPGAGPAAARNVGWQASRAEWIVFLDDDVLPGADWLERLSGDLRAAGPEVAATQGRIEVPLPAGRAPTDWERNTRRLERAHLATADIAYRRTALAAVGGFDERFRRAYREDTDLALRVAGAGYRSVRGSRGVRHPVRPASPWVSVRLQAGNADDVLMRRLHGPRWRDMVGEPRGRRRRHLIVTAAGLLGGAGIATGHRRIGAAGAAAWLAGTAELAWARIAPGPRTAAEIAAMVATSAALPAVATLHTLAATVRHANAGPKENRRPEAVLLDRDGTLVTNVPYNADPDRVVPMPGAREALARLREAGVPVAVVSNQSGIGRGLVSIEQVSAVNRRIEQLLGPLGPWFFCPHRPDDACSCRKPEPGLVVGAARALGVDPSRCALVGDVWADVEAAQRVGARPILVPNPETRPDEVAAAPEVAGDLPSAVELLLGGKP
jgi:histidinol-phosphate phosphatase family protein